MPPPLGLVNVSRGTAPFGLPEGGLCCYSGSPVTTVGRFFISSRLSPFQSAGIIAHDESFAMSRGDCGISTPRVSLLQTQVSNKRAGARGVTMDQWAGVILAAGQGSRLKSQIPKPLHRVCGKEMIRYPIELMQYLGVGRTIVVVSPANKEPIKELLGDQVEYVVQPRVTGTADAVALAADLLRDQVDNLLVMGTDTPLISPETVARMMKSHLSHSDDMTVLTAEVGSPEDLGLIRRNDQGLVVDIVEASDRTASSEGPGEVNGGVYCFSAAWLLENLGRIEPSRTGERYLTSLAPIGAVRNSKIRPVSADDCREVQGVNDRIQLANAEAGQRQRIREHWMLAGVTMLDPTSVYIDADVSIGPDTMILPNTMLLGHTTIGEACEIGPSSIIRDSTIGSNCRATASMVEEATMEENVDLGPFSHLRPGAYLESGVHIGNFAEIKESRFSAGAVMGHFGYVGDASVGANVNLGAGMITCNYDGKDKHRTVIEDGAFVGCDTMFIAPVTLGAHAVTGAGSVVTKDVPPGRLAVGVPAKIRDRKAN